MCHSNFGKTCFQRLRKKQDFWNIKGITFWNVRTLQWYILRNQYRTEIAHELIFSKVFVIFFHANLEGWGRTHPKKEWKYEWTLGDAPHPHPHIPKVINSFAIVDMRGGEERRRSTILNFKNTEKILYNSQPKHNFRTNHLKEPRGHGHYRDQCPSSLLLYFYLHLPLPFTCFFVTVVIKF